MQNSKNKIILYNRETKKIEEEMVFEEGLVKFCYENKFGRILTKSIFKRRKFSNLIRLLEDSKFSIKKIMPFINRYNIDTKEFEKKVGDFRSFNDFFMRKLKKESRPIDTNSNILVSPADSRLISYDIKEDSIIPVKGISFTIEELLRDKDLAKKYINGKCLVFRLVPCDYHRFCYIDNGEHGKVIKLDGVLYSVNPIALSQKFKVFQENYREHCCLETENFDKVIYMEVGAVGVGRIKQNYMNGTSFKKGEEKGYFEFGGSTVVLLFKENVIELDQDILENSKKGIETLVRYGSGVGKVKELKNLN